MLNRSPIKSDSPAQFSAELPNSVDVVIVGAGIIGISTALALSKQGSTVLVCEKGRVAAEQSSRNWGWVRQTGRDADELPIMIEALDLWRTMASRTGENCLKFSEQGVLYLANSEADMERHSRFVSLAKLHGLESHLLTSDEVKKRLPASTKKWAGGLLTTSDGRVEPWSAVPAMARVAARAGACIIESCAVRSLQITNGTATGVITEHGVVNAQCVLLAAGAWSSLLAGKHNMYLPQLSVKSTVARVDNIGLLGDGNAADDELAFCRRSDGGYTIALTDSHQHFIGRDSFRHLHSYLPGLLKTWSENQFSLAAPKGYPDAWLTPRRWCANDKTPFEFCRVLDPNPDPSNVKRMLSRLQSRFSGCEQANVSHAWSGMIDTLPDFVPVIDQAKDIHGLFVATGFSGHGFGIGPAVGNIMANKILGKSIEHDLIRFRLDRFRDGSPLRLGPI